MASGDSLSTRYRGKIILAGPKKQESAIRNQFESMLQERQYLGNCYANPTGGASFEVSGWTARIAFKIAWNTPFRDTGPTSSSRIEIKKLEVIYRNPPGPWKKWVDITNNINSVRVPGMRSEWDPGR